MNCPHCGKSINPAAMLGSISSPAKAQAARENAKLGGWPKGKKRGKRKRVAPAAERRRERIGARQPVTMKSKKASKSRRPAPIRSTDGLCGVELIAAERQRQIAKEKWSKKHDDGHKQRELARAAHSYVGHYVHRAWVFMNELEMPGVRDGEKDYRNEAAPEYWPWDEKDWNPQAPLRDLVKAGALIAAEIDRLQRARRKPHNEKLTNRPSK